MDRRSSLEAAAKSGNIDLLYELIHEDPSVLDKMDDVAFVNTPLHVAAVAGKTEFAMEVINLKPSFARKLNADGLTPLHLAVDHGHFSLVLEIVKADPSLVRVKGRHGM
ncbi:PREDICTED: alpha-latroinsectotoxin-Lt1a-like isoform X3 [Camelina sativa]|uniref:Alpha-latroinsectotoxin-Lt1a-like isoform X3 n=1 Tax=Camelina sativa TaxID=90675 RepID=A0ABM0T363_CAMSA|nr:PREDICTED: alpha-latroinsectotoxin-Lt1a-like isoform X3 [Camelina sativa]